MGKKRRILLNGIEVLEGWPERLADAQRVTRFTSKGEQRPRIAYGGEELGWGDTPCRDCAAKAGQYHVLGCEYEKCPFCGEMISSHECDIDELDEEEDDAGSRLDQLEARAKKWLLIIIALLAAGGLIWLKKVGAF